MPLPNITFGDSGDAAPDWRSDKALEDEVDPDDELLPETPPDVIDMLGFDPRDVDEDDKDV